MGLHIEKRCAIGSSPSCLLALPAAMIVMMCAGSAAAADIMPGDTAAAAHTEPAALDWTGFYLGGHLGYAWGNSDWTASTVTAPYRTIASGSFSLARPIDSFNEFGKLFRWASNRLQSHAP